MRKMSRFLKEAGVPHSDLRGKHCAACGKKITKENFAMSSTQLKKGKWTKVAYFCNDCFLESILSEAY